MATTYYVRLSGKTYGPFDTEKLKRLAAAGKISCENMISTDGKSGWVVAGKVKGLFATAESIQSPSVLPMSETAVADKTGDALLNAPQVAAATVSPGSNLQPCRDCGELVSIHAPACPRCGCPASKPSTIGPLLSNLRQRKATILVAAVILGGIVVGYAILPNKSAVPGNYAILAQESATQGNTGVELVAAIAAALGASWASGINLYAAVAMLGCMHRFGGVELPGDLVVLSSWWVIVISAAMYCVEFVADKIPYVDSVWDVVHTFIRIPAGAALAAGSFADFDPVVRTVLFLVGGTIAASSHGTKALTRATINTSPEPVSNILASTGEDAVAFGVVWLAVRHPILAIVAVVALLALTIYLLPKIIRLFLSIVKQIATVLGLRSPDARAQ